METKRSATRVQAWARACSHRRRYRRRVRAALHVQTLFRFQLWKYVLRVTKRAAWSLTRWYTSCLARWRLREWLSEAEMAAAKVRE